MHAERLRAVADLIEEQGDEHFDLEQWFTDTEYGHCPPTPIQGVHAVTPFRDDNNPRECGTTACVAGWASVLMHKEGAQLSNHWINWEQNVREWLGLTEHEAAVLFIEDHGRCIWHRVREDYGWLHKRSETSLDVKLDISASDAADVLRKIADGVYEL